MPPDGEGTVDFEWNDYAVTVGKEIEHVPSGAKVYFVIDEPGDKPGDKPKGEFNECKEDDNRSEITVVPACPMA